MGSTGAIGFAEQVAFGNVKLESALIWHLQSNHYPPLPLALLPVALKAIENGNAQLWDEEITMPEGIGFRNKPTAKTADVIETMHLDSFLDEMDEWEY